MSAKAFIDTNVFIYLYSDDESAKQEIAQKAVNKYECNYTKRVDVD
jgi:predicted nucleic acid-binding protein